MFFLKWVFFLSIPFTTTLHPVIVDLGIHNHLALSLYRCMIFQEYLVNLGSQRIIQRIAFVCVFCFKSRYSFLLCFEPRYLDAIGQVAVPSHVESLHSSLYSFRWTQPMYAGIAPWPSIVRQNVWILVHNSSAHPSEKLL